MNEVVIRRAEVADVPALLEIYNHYIVNTHITFDLEPRTLDQHLGWLAKFASDGRYRCFVAVRRDGVIGWACSAPFRERAAYQTSVETSIYLAPEETGHGIGSRLYRTLLESIERMDVHRAYGGVALPNEASVRLHTRMGFEHIGTYREVGRKFDRFWDVAIYGRPCPKP